MQAVYQIDSTPSKNNWCPRGESNSQNSASKADTYASSVTGAWIKDEKSALHFGCALARWATRGLRAPRRHRCTGGSLSPAHPARPSTRLSSGGGAKAHPKWLLSEPQAGSLRRCHAQPSSAASCERALTACGTITSGTENQIQSKTKRPGTLRCPGLCEESLEGNAPTRSLHPVANDPHRAHVRTNQLPDTAAGAGRHTVRPQRRARARGPVRVGGW